MLVVCLNLVSLILLQEYIARLFNSPAFLSQLDKRIDISKGKHVANEDDEDEDGGDGDDDMMQCVNLE